ncbi:uncharacterized protein LY79DRAFT_665076 [Colletotrichum navitas]|uniref:Uncharacterized protein n=1 Tax=Colletotrichum navitas TaxID=681940 RepID=A0AAD8QDL4_9PEZI|nr:uncharacterized protein LY79DRAFT_665076 [Colletotrichum navitas]KAK1599383.1 hypothetical protein LY79DRAFT_665076 [Colletotrichum navitas]
MAFECPRPQALDRPVNVSRPDPAAIRRARHPQQDEDHRDAGFGHGGAERSAETGGGARGYTSTGRGQRRDRAGDGVMDPLLVVAAVVSAVVVLAACGVGAAFQVRKEIRRLAEEDKKVMQMVS